MTQGKCIANPKDEILNCLYYKSLTECFECVPGYHIDQEGKACKAVISIPNCESYSGKAKDTHCLKCESTYYLFSKNVCKLRVNSIQNC